MVGPEQLTHALQGERQRQRFRFGVNRYPGFDLLFETRQGYVRVFAQALSVRFGAFIRGAQQYPGIAEKYAVETGAALDEDLRCVQVPFAD